MTIIPRFPTLLLLAALGGGRAETVPAANFDWPQWRGPDRTDISKETGLLKSWPEGGPKRVWLFENAGNGYSGPAIVNGRLYTMGTRDSGEIVLALDANTGREVWAATIDAILENGWGGGPRATPTVEGGQVYVVSGNGKLVCLEASDGRKVWEVTMRSLGGSVPNWGYTESVLVDGDQVVCTPGGSKGAVAALDKQTGKVLWQSTDLTDPAHYSSIVVARINGEKQYVQRTEKAVFGIAPRDGKVLWRTSFPNGRTAVIPTPIVKGNQVYVSAGYGAGCKMVTIEPGNKVKEEYDNKVIINHHGGVLLLGDHLYGHSDRERGLWVCQNFATGEEVWSHGGLGKGAVTYADGRLYCLDERSGTVALAEATPTGWKEHGRFKLDPQSKTRSSRGMIWTHPVISNGRLYLRDQEFIYCFDVKGGV